MKIISLFISIIVCIGVSGCKKDNSQSFSPENFFPKILKSEKFIQEKTLILFLAEGMCSECINKEFMNLKEQGKLLDNIVVVGVFSNKRIFDSCVNSLRPKTKIFCNMMSLPENEKLPQSPIYLIYEQKRNRISDIFYPQACRVSQTLEYFKNIRTTVLSED